ncbi:Protein transport protein SEC16B-like protein [Abeliophyllum distichum]|uniref:Protein transport protein sec16 n=1 Tax=Abeliophyllum distichum TaxID=126358 RepID=A0ABD1Q799_9LAMI
MASNPLPFRVEDNTDEDFFDKLVNDDDDMDFKITATSSPLAGLSFTDGNESNEAKALKNLSINEVENNSEVDNNFARSDGFTLVDELSKENGEVEKVASVWESRGPLVSSNSFEFDTLIHEPKNEIGGSEDLSDTTVLSKSSSEGSSDTVIVRNGSGGSGCSGVKEVDWSAFNADSTQNDSNDFGSYSDFFSEVEGDKAGDAFGNVGVSLNKESKVASGNEVHGYTNEVNSIDLRQYQEGYNFDTAADQDAPGQDLNSSQYWENLYPGWKYDLSSGQWYQVDDFDAGASLQENVYSNSTSMPEGKANISYLQQTAQTVVATVGALSTIESVTDWNQASQVNDATESTTNWNQVSEVSSDTTGVALNQDSHVNGGYPLHMVFDPQYPGWYYDTIAQEWCSLESFTASDLSTAQTRVNQNGYASTDTVTQNNDHKTDVAYGQVNNYGSQGFSNQGQDHNWAGSFGNYNQQSSRMWKPETVAKNEPTSQYSGNRQLEDYYGQNFSVNSHGSEEKSVNHGETGSYYENVSQGQNGFGMPAGSQNSVLGVNFNQQFNQSGINQNDHKQISNDYHSKQNLFNFSQQHIQSAHQFSYAPAAERSSAGRPPHALVTFGFGGKLIVIKDSSSAESSNFGSQNPVGGSISVLNLADIVKDKVDASMLGIGACNYFRALCQQSFPGPLTGGGVGIKELNKWIDERIANSGAADMDYRKGEVLRLLLSVLKIACQYYGKLRSPFGTDTVLKESDTPESAVANLFTSAKRNGTQFSQYGAATNCLQQMPSEVQMRVTASEVQNLLVSGRKKEALQCAQEGQFWGPALVVAAQLGDQFYVDALKQMALCQFVAGSPLRTLCLLIAGQPADVFSADATASSNMSGALNMPHQPAQFGANGILDDWEENLAVITANRTKDDELVLLHFGDSLWKDRSDIIAAHICYLVAEASFEPYSDSARLCLVGADHWKYPRTYASPEAIQRTEIHEYSKTLGNSQFVLLPFQPYKLVYAHMLAEVGRLSDALKYCQAVLKSLKTGRSPEVETLRQSVSSLEERIKSHQQGGFSTNLAPKKLVGKLLNLFDSTAHRVVGGLPPPAPTNGTVQVTEHRQQSVGPRVSASQSALAMSSLIPSQSTEHVSEWPADSNRMTMHTRSVSEPDFGRSPRQGRGDSSKEASSASEQDKTPAGSSSRFGRFSFGSQLFQKTVGLVMKPRQGRQAKLGETNKFYYDEKLKRWVEEGSETPVEEAALPPPPSTAVFNNGTSDYNLRNTLQSEASHSNGTPEIKTLSTLNNNSGMPPLPPTSNQFSARGRVGIRSRYVDTFNQGGGNPTNLFQSPSAASTKPASGAKLTFFVPTPVSSVEQPVDTPTNTLQDTSSNNETPLTSSPSNTFQSPRPPSSVTMQRYASMDSISNKGTSDNSSFSVHSRRRASWSGSLNDSISLPNTIEVRPLREVLGVHPSSFVHDDSSLVHSSTNGGNFSDNLHEVEL